MPNANDFSQIKQIEESIFEIPIQLEESLESQRTILHETFLASQKDYEILLASTIGILILKSLLQNFCGYMPTKHPLTTTFLTPAVWIETPNSPQRIVLLLNKEF